MQRNKTPEVLDKLYPQLQYEIWWFINMWSWLSIAFLVFEINKSLSRILEIICDQKDPHVFYWDAYSGQNITSDETVGYLCKPGYTSTDGATWATCTKDGWRPNPLCQGIGTLQSHHYTYHLLCFMVLIATVSTVNPQMYHVTRYAIILNWKVSVRYTTEVNWFYEHHHTLTSLYTVF